VRPCCHKAPRIPVIASATDRWTERHWLITEGEFIKHEAIATSSSPGVKALAGDGLAEASTLTEREAAQVERANASGAPPVVFVHGLWLLPSSWERWVKLFEEAGFVGVTPGWPDVELLVQYRIW
jgi:hypothetical protein